MLPGIMTGLLAGAGPLSARLSSGAQWSPVAGNIYEALVSAFPEGGVPPYTYLWGGNANITASFQGTAGMRYTIGAPTPRLVNCTITDATGEVVVPTTTIAAPDPE